MTYRTYFQTAIERLQAVSGEDATFEARCLLEDLAHLPHGGIPDDRELTDEQVWRLDRAIVERENGRPLQYILGEWDFLSLRLSVGEGVLIPRPDTEVLCETVAGILRRMPGENPPKILDLCAGSGCVGLGVASLLPDVSVTALEKSPAALSFLEKNCARYPELSVSIFPGDLFTDADRLSDGWDAILSNPPYIPSADIVGLMPEVKNEPAMALDGGKDGLDFYRTIAKTWVKKLRPGGVCAVEIGFDQGPAVEQLFADAGLIDRQIVKDFAGHDRVVLGFAPEI